MKNRFFTVSALVFTVTMAGCGSSESPPYNSFANQSSSTEQSENSLSPSFELTQRQRPSQDAASDAVRPNNLVAPDKVVVDPARKIIYTANLNLVVDSFDNVADSMVRMSTDFGGFVQKANVTGNSGSRRTGSWTLRIPSQSYREFLASAGKLGEVVSLNEQAREVTAEFHDVDARIRNKLREEERLNKILEERPGKLDDVLSVEREVSRVREEIERMQGRLRVLRDQTSYSTISLTVTEIQHYAPPAAPSFGTQIRRQWDSTVTSLTDAFQATVLWSIAVGPWLLIAFVIGSLWMVVNRRLLKKHVKV